MRKLKPDFASILSASQFIPVICYNQQLWKMRVDMMFRNMVACFHMWALKENNFKQRFHSSFTGGTFSKPPCGSVRKGGWGSPCGSGSSGSSSSGRSNHFLRKLPPPAWCLHTTKMLLIRHQNCSQSSFTSLPLKIKFQPMHGHLSYFTWQANAKQNVDEEWRSIQMDSDGELNG